MNEDLMRQMGFGSQMDDIKIGRCPLCGSVIHHEDFTDTLSYKEFKISGMCQECQNKTF